MQKLAVLILAAVAFSCNNSGTAARESTKDSTTAAAATTTESYPYTLERSGDWETGSTANTMLALKSLKAWEEGKMDESLKYFGDSVRVQFDGLDKLMSNDSLKAMLSGGWNSFRTVKERMQKSVSVVSKDGKEEWVSIWYTQSWETKDGVKDSSAVMNDMQIKGGKIVWLTEYNRKLH